MLQEPQQPPRLPRSTAIMLAPIEPVPVWDAVCMTLSSAVEIAEVAHRLGYDFVQEYAHMLLPACTSLIICPLPPRLWCNRIEKLPKHPMLVRLRESMRVDMLI